MSDRKPENPPLLALQITDEDGTRDVVVSSVFLRDLFAAASLAGMEANQQYDMSHTELAKAAYKQADALLAEREERS